MKQYSVMKRIISLVICLTMILTYLPAGLMKAEAADSTLGIVSDSKKADPSTMNDWLKYFGPDKMDTEFAGAVWTDKSVFTQATDALPGISLTDSKNFLVALSAIASNLSIVGHTSAPTDTVLVLDLSASMVNDTYQVGTIRRNNRYRTVSGIDMSLVQAMIDATNETIHKLMTQNTNNRVGVVLYSGNTYQGDASANTATVVLPLDRYTGVNGEYLSLDANWQTEPLYQRRGNSYTATGETATYVEAGSTVSVSVKDGLKTETGGNVANTSKQVSGGTYIQNGLYHAMEQFLSVTDTVVPEGKPQAGVARLPVLVLMSDGAPTNATTDYADVGTSDVGDGTETDDKITFLTQLTAAYVRGAVTEHYKQSVSDEREMLLLTLGLGTENSTAATNTLYPLGSSNTLKGYWETYLAASADANVTVTSGLTVERKAAVKAMNYVDTYFYASNADGLINSFNDILSEISLKAESYATLVESGGADFSGYVTFEDELGELMHVADMKGILVGDGEGGTILFTGKGVAESLVTGVLGTVDTPTERGNELVRTVKERIPGLTTTQAQQLIGYAYNDKQLYYTDDNNWSNYIGWYADADGKYVGFWDKDSGYENAPAGAVYANRSYGYLGINDDSDMMHVVVMVQTKLSTLHQTVKFKIPASLLPTVQYKVTLSQDDPDQVESFVREEAVPMRLVFEVGLQPGINSVNLNQKIDEHIARGGHVHKNADGTVTVYTNQFSIGNDTNGNGIPDPEEVENAIVAQSHFHPALDNSRFYYTDDTVILTDGDAPVTGTTRPNGGAGYYYNRYIYTETGRTVIPTPIAAATLENDAEYDSVNGYWYIPAGTVYRNLTRFRTGKTENTTGTLDYSFYPAVFDNTSKQDVYMFLGNNGSFTVAPAQGIALTKTVAEVSEETGAPTTFTFKVTLSQAVAEPLITDTDGTPLLNVASVSGNVITVTLKAGQTVVISGLPTGTKYTVEEESSLFYASSSANASGTVSAYTVHAVDFVNTAKGFGSLVVSKNVNYPEGFAPGAAHNSKTFTIHVAFTGDTTGMVVPQGAVQNGNTYTLTLADGQSATFANIPEGVTYVVTEDNIPAGYEQQDLRYSDEHKTIDGKDLDEVHVVNRYTLQPVSPNVKVQGTKTLVTNNASWNGQTFTVELFEIINFADDAPVSTGLTATMTETNPHYEIDLSTLSFDKAGIYYFRAVEQIPDDRDENIAYDRTFGLFSVTVGDADANGDADADGRLEIQSVDAYQNTGITGDSTTGWILTKNFTNVVTTDRLYLNIQKHIVDADTSAAVNNHLGDMTFGLFTEMSDTAAPVYYALTDTQGKATLMIPVTQDQLNDAGGNLVYYMREIAPEVANRVVGMRYDESWIYAVEITWDGVNNQAVMTYAPIINNTVGTYVPYTEGFTFTHTNTYESNVSVELELSGSKTLNGGTDLGGRTFSFSLFESTAAFVLGDRIRQVSNSGNAISFNGITFTAPGVYYMVAKEDASNLGGITVDSTEYHITVEVERFSDTDGTTRLRLVDGYPVVIAYGTSNNVGADGLNFNNIYTVTGSGDVTVGGKKVLNGRAMVAGEFTIGLYRDVECTDLIESTVNKADGTFAFSAMTFTPAHLGEGYAEKTYTYYVKEVAGSKGGVTYDPNVYTVTVTVKHDEAGNLVVTPSDNAATLQITNTYVARPVDAVLSGSKVLSGNWDAVANKDFTFQLFQADSAFVIQDQPLVDQKTVTGNGSFSMTLHYEDGQERFYYYVLKEDISAQAGGIGYDAGEYHITVNVTDPGDGQLVALTTVYRPGTGNVTNAVFTNVYAVEPTTVTLEGKKNYTNTDTNTAMDMEEDEFSFQVLEGDDLVSSGYNKADGTIEFEPIRYTQAGVHNYTVVEVKGDAGGVTYDDTEFAVVVTVVDNGDGTLTASVDYNNSDKCVEFNNTYTHKAAQVTLNGEKALSGDWSAVSSGNKTFTFELYETNEYFEVSGEPTDYVNSSDGTFTFGEETFTEEGIWYYVVLEAAGAAGNGITYDSTRYHITVKVEDNGSGQLIPTVTVQGATVTVDPANAGHVTVSGLNFTNSYAAERAQYTPEVQKNYETNGQMKNFDFVLEMNGASSQTKQNDDAGKVKFDTLYFDTVGEYTLTIREQKNILGGLIRWDTNVYTITLHVEDNGAGKLFVNEEKTEITSIKGTTDLVFRNADHEVITNKDVFLLSDPTVSIDGKIVEKNDILVYQISYTNFDSIPVDVVITDTIPEHTTYMAGTADNGGVYNNGELTWTLEDVTPGATVTVSFQVKVADTTGEISNSAKLVEGGNTYETKPVTNTIREDKIEKDVFLPGSETVSINGDDVEKNVILLYKITYTNSDDAPATVTITDFIPEHTTYLDGFTSDNGVFDENEGKLTWTLELAPGASKTVSFRVKVTGAAGEIVSNKATAVEGDNSYTTESVENPITEDEVKKEVFLPGSENVKIDNKKVEKGDILLYKITYKNNDDFPTAVTITDTIPAYTAYVNNSVSDGGVYDNGVLTWNLVLNPKSEMTVSFEVTVTGEDGQTITNQASAVAGENHYTTDPVTNPITDDEAKKEAYLYDGNTSILIDNKKVEKGDVLEYKITYTNSDDFAANVTITDTIPEHTTYEAGSASDGGTFAGGKVTWTLQLTPGESKTVSFRVKVADTKVIVENTATAQEGNNKIDTNTTRTSVEQDLVSKDVFLFGGENTSINGEKVEKGDILLYKITYQNLDGFGANVTITDIIPAYTAYVEGSASHNAVFAGGKLTWNLQLEAGASKTVTFKVEVTGQGGQTVSNQATAQEGDNFYTTNPVSNPITEDTVKKDVAMLGNENVTIDGKKVEKGDVLIYKITYTNNDSFPATVTITDTIPAYTAYVENSASDGGIYSNGVLTWTLQLQPGESTFVTFRVEVTGAAGKEIENQATAQEGNNIYTTDPVKNTITEDEVKKEVFLPGSENVKIDNKKVEKGDILEYRITYTNTDDFSATVTVTDMIPAYTTFVSADSDGTFAEGKVTWTFQLNPGASKTVSFQVKVTGAAGKEIENQATAVEGENSYTTNSVKNIITEDEAKKEVFLSGGENVKIDGKKVEKGDVLEYRITYTNTDDFSATVTVTDTIPDYTAYVENSASDGAVYDNGVLTWTLVLEPGASKTVTFKVTVTGKAGQEIANQATAQEGSNIYTTDSVKNPITEDEAKKEAFLVGSETVSIDGKKVEKGDVLEYKITYTNNDDFSATVTITDVIPHHTTYEAGSASDGGTYAEGKVTWELQVAAGDSVTVSFRVKVADDKVTLENTASAKEGNNEIFTNSVRNAVEQDLVSKDVFRPSAPTVSIDGKVVEKGDELLYKITYQNLDGAAATVTITDTIPEYTAYVAGSADNGGTYAEGKLTWVLQLNGGESKTVSFRVKVVETNVTVVNQASAAEGGNQYQTNKVTNPVKEDTFKKDVVLSAAPTVSIDGKVVEKGDELLYKITYTNTDDFSAKVTITDTIPANTAYVEGSADHGAVFAGGKLVWNLELSGGETKTVTFKVKVTGAGEQPLSNEATAVEGGNQYQTNKVTNPVKEDTLEKDVFLSADPTVSIDGKKVEKGDELLYKITYTNSDDFAANVTITDSIPAYTVYVEGSADNGAVFADGKLTWNLELEPGESKTVSFKVTVAGKDGQAITNQASALEGENRIETEQVTGTVTEDTVEKNVFQSGEPTVSVDGEKVESGKELIYTITYTNADDFSADVTITDTIPANTTYVEGSADHGAVFAEGKLVWNLQLAAGETRTVSFKVTVTGHRGQTVTNQAFAQEGENRIETNQITNTVYTVSTIPETGDEMNLGLLLFMMLSSVVCLFVLVLSKKRFTE